MHQSGIFVRFIGSGRLHRAAGEIIWRSLIGGSSKTPKGRCARKWINVRDSVIHADSKANWSYHGDARTIEPQFLRMGDLNFTKTDLTHAFQNMLSAVRWYIDQVDQTKEKTKGSQILFGGVPTRR